MPGNLVDGCTPQTNLITTPERDPLATTNYSFEKRQREIAKKKKQDNKQAKKMASRDGTRSAPEARASTAKST
ncbi:hypothetical protein [Dyella agri]|uniref:Uncharacterized protein n=1 Tax=Dyella agri TaxID=1926869 RepID=A0ABW8KKU4_9GAMM